MELEKAIILAQEIIDVIKPYCNKIEIAGSVRRKKELVKDIELVVTTPNLNTLKNKLGFFMLKENKFDLFVADENNFGLIFLIRTGSAEFSTKMLAQWKKVTKGGKSINGYLHDSEGNKYDTPTEESVFEL